MSEPKRRHSRQRQGKRRSKIRLKLATLVACANCRQLTKPHMVCSNCGYYKGKAITKHKTKNQVVAT